MVLVRLKRIADVVSRPDVRWEQGGVSRGVPGI